MIRVHEKAISLLSLVSRYRPEVEAEWSGGGGNGSVPRLVQIRAGQEQDWNRGWTRLWQELEQAGSLENLLQCEASGELLAG